MINATMKAPATARHGDGVTSSTEPEIRDSVISGGTGKAGGGREAVAATEGSDRLVASAEAAIGAGMSVPTRVGTSEALWPGVNDSVVALAGGGTLPPGCRVGEAVLVAGGNDVPVALVSATVADGIWPGNGVGSTEVVLGVLVASATSGVPVA